MPWPDKVPTPEAQSLASPRRSSELPEDYATRLSEMAPGQFRRLRMLAPDAYDCILSKLEPKDGDDADYLFRSQKLDARALHDRYRKELRYLLIGKIEWHDRTLELWIDIFTAPR
jgi:hypothetical protein